MAYFFDAEENTSIFEKRAGRFGWNFRGEIVEFRQCSDLVALPSGFTCSVLQITECRKFKEVPADIRVDTLIIERCDSLTSIPAGVEAKKVVIKSCKALRELPSKWELKSFNACECPNLVGLPDLGSFAEVTVKSCGIVSLPPGEYKGITIEGCHQLTSLPAGLCGGDIHIAECSSLESIPSVSGYSLFIGECKKLKRISVAKVKYICIENCPTLYELPPDLDPDMVRITNCPNLTVFTEWAAAY